MKSAIILILIFIVFFGSIISIAWNQTRDSNFAEFVDGLISIPEITASVRSEETGRYHTVNVEFVLETETDHGLTVSQLEQDLTRIVQGLNFDNIDSVGNVEYIREGVINGLRNIGIEVINVFVANIHSR